MFSYIWSDLSSPRVFGWTSKSGPLTENLWFDHNHTMLLYHTFLLSSSINSGLPTSFFLFKIISNFSIQSQYDNIDLLYLLLWHQHGNFCILISYVIRGILVQQSSILMLLNINTYVLTVKPDCPDYGEEGRYLKHLHNDCHLPKIQIH